MNTDLLAAVRNGTDFVAAMPCGATLMIPGPVLSGWATTPAPPELLDQASALTGAEFSRGDGGAILDVILQLLPTLLPVLLPLLINSIAPPKDQPPTVVPVVPR